MNKFGADLERAASSDACALVLGGYVNGYSIIRELHENGVRDLWLFDSGTSLARHSRYLKGVSKIDRNPLSLLAELENLHRQYGKIVVFPTDDLQLEMLLEIYRRINDYCFLPFNSENLSSALDKNVQYYHCERLGIPYPKSRLCASKEDIDEARELTFPVIVKPSKRNDLDSGVFRNLYVDDYAKLLLEKESLLNYMEGGIEFLISECIPGDDTTIYAYTAYRSMKNGILNEWIGKKLTQFPDRFGVFSSASNQAPDIIRQQGRCLLEGMDLLGVAEPEFKFDSRDGKYKLMEINLRSMMWHRTGNLSGVNLQFTQWLDAVGQDPPLHSQNMKPVVHFVYMKHELVNLMTRRGYLKYFLHNVFGGEKRGFAVFNREDIFPFFYDLSRLPGYLVKSWLKLLHR